MRRLHTGDITTSDEESVMYRGGDMTSDQSMVTYMMRNDSRLDSITSLKYLKGSLTDDDSKISTVFKSNT